MTNTHWLHQMPCHNFNCLIVYYTPSGLRKSANVKTRATSADLALEIAERLLRRDKRRSVSRVTFGRAIQQ